MGSHEKFVIIGAGSAMFTRGLVSDLMASGQECEVALVDIDPLALKTAEQLVGKMIAAKHAPIRLSASVDRKNVLKGATVVITTIGVGKRRAWEQDVFVPRKYGIYMPVGDTVGPGGTSRALRMIPDMVDIARDVIDLAPDALFFNYANPMSAVCRGVIKATGVKMTGLCHGVIDTARWLSRLLDVPLASLSYNAVGINHLTWFTEMRVDGQDAMPRLHAVADEVLARLAEAKAAHQAGAPMPHNGSPFEVIDEIPVQLAVSEVVQCFPGPARPARVRVLPAVLPRGLVLRQDAGCG